MAIQRLHCTHIPRCMIFQWLTFHKKRTLKLLQLITVFHFPSSHGVQVVATCCEKLITRKQGLVLGTNGSQIGANTAAIFFREATHQTVFSLRPVIPVA